MKYLVTMKPLEPYLFGNDHGFLYEGVDNAGKETYFIRSLEVPEQTTILGMLRYITLEHENLLKPDFIYKNKDELKKMEFCIGAESFHFSAEKKQLFGFIKKISPVFIINKDGHYLVKAPFHIQKTKDSNQTYRFMEMSLESENNIETSAGYIQFPKEYNAKEGHASGYFDLNSKTMADPDLFSSIITSGNRKTTPDESNENCFFKKELKYLKEGYSFAVYVEADKLPEKTIAYMGQKKSTFLITAQENKKEDLEQRVKSTLEPLIIGNDTWFYALSDILLQHPVHYDHFCIVEEKKIRNLETLYGEKSQTKRLRKSSKQYNFIQSGSVFYQNCPNFTKEEQNENCRQIGYNYIVQIGGK